MSGLTGDVIEGMIDRDHDHHADHQHHDEDVPLQIPRAVVLERVLKYLDAEVLLMLVLLDGLVDRCSEPVNVYTSGLWLR